MENEKKPAKISLSVFIIFAVVTALIIATLMYCVFADRTEKSEVPATTTQNVSVQ